MSETSKTLKPTHESLPTLARKLRRHLQELEARGITFTLTVSESEGYKSTRLFYWIVIREEPVRRPFSYGAIYASTLHYGVTLNLAHHGSGGRTSEKFVTGKLTRIGSKDKNLKNLRDCAQWAVISLANPYVPTPEQKVEDEARAAKYAAEQIAA